jgi:hypothetical protein
MKYRGFRFVTAALFAAIYTISRDSPCASYVKTAGASSGLEASGALLLSLIPQAATFKVEEMTD